jgi:phosphatidate phosphatase PAH1
MEQPKVNGTERYYRKKDYTEESVAKLYSNITGGMVETYLAESDRRNGRVPLVLNPALNT